MPYYMDIHVAQNLKAEDMARAHQLDLQCQDEFECRCLTYWLDTDLGSAYCLIEAPCEEAVINLHRKAHKGLPEEIIEVDKRVVRAFLGRIHDPEHVDFYLDNHIKVFAEKPFRFILFISLRPSCFTGDLQLPSSKAARTCLKDLSEKVLPNYGGRLVEIPHLEEICSFESLEQAIEFTESITNEFSKNLTGWEWKTVIHAGNPVDRSESLFGNTLKLGSGLLMVNEPGTTLITYSAIHAATLSGNPFENLPDQFKVLKDSSEAFSSRLIQYLFENYSQPELEVSEMETYFGMSKSAFYRKVTEVFQISPNSLLSEFRLNQAFVLLSDSSGSVAQIAYDCGFSSASYFTRCFHKRFGLTPSEYLHCNSAV